MPEQVYELSGRGIADGYAVAYFFDCVLVGTVREGHYHFCKAPQWEKLQELHVFHDTVEYRAVFSLEKRWLTRTRDDIKDPGDHYDETLMMIGIHSKASPNKEGFYLASEAGRAIMLPESIRAKGIIIRNYIHFDEMGDGLNERCVLQDWRFCGFAPLKEGEFA